MHQSKRYIYEVINLFNDKTYHGRNLNVLCNRANGDLENEAMIKIKPTTIINYYNLKRNPGEEYKTVHYYKFRRITCNVCKS